MWCKELLCYSTGLPVEEIHLCGHESALPLVRRLTDTIGDHLEVSHTGFLPSCSFSPLFPLAFSHLLTFAKTEVFIRYH